MKILESLVELLSWLKIVASPTIIAVVCGSLFYLYKPGIIGLAGGVLLSITGLVAGIIIATRISKKTGAAEFNSRIYSSPDFDEAAKNQ